MSEAPRETPPVDPLNPDDRFTSRSGGAEFTVGDFWAWAMADLRMNTARGMLVEYLVAKAVGAKASARVEWAPFDIEAPDGTRIEIKASGYSQSWGGRDSRPSYSFGSVFSDQYWDEVEGKYRWVDPANRVHVWVFALNTTRRSSPYEALNLDCWEFRVVPHVWLLDCGQKSAALSFFDRHGIEPVGWADLPEAIKNARLEHDRLRRAPEFG